MLLVVAVAALHLKLCRLGRHHRSANDNTRDSDQPRDGEGVKVADRDIFGARVQEQLVFGKIDLCLVGEDDSVRALLQGGFELREEVRIQSCATRKPK